MPRCSLVLLCVALVGCGAAAPSVRHSSDAQRRCVYVPSRDEAAGAWKDEVPSTRAGVHVVLVAAPAGASPVALPAPSPAPALEGLSGEGLGNGIPRGVLRLVPEGGAGAEVGAGGAAGEAVVVGGAVVAAVGSGLLVCLTASAAADGAKTPIEIADEYYGTHFSGGARSDTGEPYRTENALRGVAKENPQGRRFHAAATELWGQLHPYTGY